MDTAAPTNLPEEPSQPTTDPAPSYTREKIPQHLIVSYDSKPLDQPQQKFEFHSLGIIQSCFKLKYCTPRQGSLCPLSRCKLTLHKHIPAISLDGIEQYSHVWLIFIFHDNDNKVFRSKVSPPKLNGAKVGVFATRSPHRLNPIGMSLVKLDKRIDNTLYFSGADLIEGTPIIDIKPIHAIEMNTEMTVAPWMAENVEKRIEVEFSEQAREDLHYYVDNKMLEFYDKFEDVYQAIYDTLSLDPRETYVRKKGDSEAIWGFCFDALNVTYRVIDGKVAQIVGLKYVGKEYKEQYKRRPVENPSKALEGQTAKESKGQDKRKKAKERNKERKEEHERHRQEQKKNQVVERKFGKYVTAIAPVVASVGLYLLYNWAKNRKISASSI